MAAKFFTGLPLDGPDPECVRGLRRARRWLARGRATVIPKPDADHSRSAPRTPAPRPGDDRAAARQGVRHQARWPGCRGFRRVAAARRRSPGAVAGPAPSTCRARPDHPDRSSGWTASWRTPVDPIVLGGRTAPSRVIFGPHETNLARRREIQRPAPGLLRAPRSRRHRRARHRDGVSDLRRLAVRAGTVGCRLRTRLGRARRGMPSLRHCAARRPGSRRRAGV